MIAQTQPLSRNDVAQVERLENSYKEHLSNQRTMQASRDLNDIAYLHWEHNDYRKAIEYYEKSLGLNQQLGNENGIAMVQNNLGMLYSDVREFDTSLSYFEKTLAARRAFRNKEGILAALKNMSVAQNNLGKHDDAIRGLEEALSTARETNDPDQISSCYLMLSETFEKISDIANTKKYYELYQSFHAMTQDREFKRLQQIADEEALLKEIAEVRARRQELELSALRSQLDEASKELDEFDAEKVRLSDALTKTQLQIQFLETEKENERLRNEEEMRAAKALRNLLMVGAISLLLISFFIYRNYRQEKKSKLALAEKNERINHQNQELESLNAIIAKHNERMQTELNVGREIQMSMLPSRFPDINGVDLFAALEPAREVGGDLYDFIQIDENHLLVGIGDVSDKGVPAALYMAVCNTLVKTNAIYSQEPGQILNEVNKELSRDNESSMFVTYFLCLLNTKTGELNFCNAGHNPPLFIPRKGDQRHLTDIHGPVLGAVEEYSYNQGTIQFEKGDQLILFTDGVTEAMDIANHQYSDKRLDEVFSQNGSYNSKDAVQVLIDDVVRFRGAAEQSDDITILSLIYTGQPNDT